MACTLTWSPTARLDLWDLVTYIADSNPAAAVRFTQAVFDKIERLAVFPESGRAVPEFNEPDIREIIIKPCRIVYRFHAGNGTVEIARIWHAARGTPEV